jgi:hypothetical protein
LTDSAEETEDEETDSAEETEDEETDTEDVTITETTYENGDVVRVRSANGEKYLLSDGQISFADGTVYDGPVKGQKPEGHGCLLFPGGNVFYGRFQNGLPTEGRMVYENGVEYNGTFLRGFDEGRGTFFYTNGTQLTTRWAHS